MRLLGYVHVFFVVLGRTVLFGPRQDLFVFVFGRTLNCRVRVYLTRPIKFFSVLGKNLNYRTHVHLIHRFKKATGAISGVTYVTFVVRVLRSP